MQAIYFEPAIENTYIANILKEIYTDKVYQAFFAGKKDLTIIDAGGNIGLTSYYFSQFAKKVYALEPTPEHQKCFLATMAYNKIKNVDLHPIALGIEKGTKTFYRNTNSTMNSLNPAVNDKKDSFEVVVTDIASFLKDNSIETVDFMKIDIEGSEFDVICGESFKTVTKQINALSVELHSWANRNYGQIVTTLRDYGYTVTQQASEATVYMAERI